MDFRNAALASQQVVGWIADFHTTYVEKTQGIAPEQKPTITLEGDWLETGYPSCESRSYIREFTFVVPVKGTPQTISGWVVVYDNPAGFSFCSFIQQDVH